MDIFSACLAFGPLGVYLLLLGLINLSRRPLVVSGVRETLALGLAVSGLAVVGPMHLFMPQDAAGRFGAVVWLLLMAFYGLSLTLWIMLSRPRLVVYNMALDELQPILVQTAARIDHDSRWAGESLAMPQLRVQLQLEAYPPMRNTSLVATAGAQSISGWRRLEGALRASLREQRAGTAAHGLWLTVCGLAILAVLALFVAESPQVIAQGVERMLRP
jgi:hypothetical protein